MSGIDWGTKPRIAFLQALVLHMYQEGASTGEVVAEVINITGLHAIGAHDYGGVWVVLPIGRMLWLERKG
jgi:hypothetical protein